jgi:hypothetical protein
MALQEFVNSSEFNRTSRNIADNGVKIFFKQFNAFLAFMINFVKEMVSSVFGR